MRALKWIASRRIVPRKAGVIYCCCPPPAQWVTLETVTVPHTGAAAFSSMMLQTGVEYRLVARGYVVIGTNGTRADADYQLLSTPRDIALNGSLDFGVGVNDTVNDGLKSPQWLSLSTGVHEYNSAGDYFILFTGLGAQIGVNYHDSDYSDNSVYSTNPLRVEIQALQ
jgi:hypothetical protein